MKKYVDNFMQYRFLLSELVKKGIKLKYRRSYLGMIWSMLEPLLTMIVLTIVFGTLYGNTDRTFPVYILTGRLLYSFFSQSTKAALKSIRQNSAMIKKVYVPKYLYPLSSVLFNYVIFLISLIVLAMVSVILGVKPTFYLLQAPIALILILIMSYGCGMILATIGVFFRDMEYLWSVALMLVMVQERVLFLRLSQAFSNQQKVQLQNMGRWFRFWNWVQALIHSIQERKIFIFTEQCLDIPKNLLMRSMMRS